MGYTCSTSGMHFALIKTTTVRTRQQIPLNLPLTKLLNRIPHRPQAGAGRLRASLDEDSANDQTEIERQKLMKMMESPVISGTELRQIIFEKFNREYDCRLTRRGKRMYLQIFWKFLGQRSFPLTEEEYQLQLDAGKEVLKDIQVSKLCPDKILLALPPVFFLLLNPSLSFPLQLPSI
jgi:Domain of unknown function (DUF3067)